MTNNIYPDNLQNTPIIREDPNMQQELGSAYTPAHYFEASTFRFCPSCYFKEVMGYGKDKKGRQRYKCKHCNKVFIVNSEVIDIVLLFIMNYDTSFQDEPHMLSTRSRKFQQMNTPEAKKMFSEIIEEIGDYRWCSDDEKDIYAMKIVCRRMDYLDAKNIKQYHDSWYYLLNYYNTDVTYKLDFVNWCLVRDNGMHLSKRQNIENPLLYCNSCGSSDISTHGFNNNARRRIKCNDCKKIGVIRIKNLVREVDLILFLRRFLKDKIDNDVVVKRIIEKMCDDFDLVVYSHHFEAFCMLLLHPSFFDCMNGVFH